MRGGLAQARENVRGKRKHRLANTYVAPPPTDDLPSSSTAAPKLPKGLVRVVTDASQLDFTLTTQVASEASEQVEASTTRGKRTSSGEQPGLHTAKSIMPIRGGSLPKTTPEEEDLPTTTLPADASPTSAASLLPAGSVPAAVGNQQGATVVLLTPEEFASQVTPIRLLGAGGSGSVHEAMWNHRRVAVKLLHPSRQASPASIEAFRREVDLMAVVSAHAHVVAVLGACLTPPSMAIITELAGRGSLHAALHEEGIRPRYGTLLQIAEDVASAMAHCHALKLVHRDLKTHNVLLMDDGNAKVADFGLAAARHRTFLTLEAGASHLGTASVMAPEQFSAGQVNERCDSYAFGCLLWECITGRQCWEECSNMMQIVMAVGCERRRPPLPADCPPPLAKLIRECWRHNAALRPGFDEILERLRKIRREEAESAAMRAVELVGKAPRVGKSGLFGWSKQIAIGNDAEEHSSSKMLVEAS